MPAAPDHDGRNRASTVTIGAATERTFTHNAAGHITGDNRGAAGNFVYTINRGGRISGLSRNAVTQGAYTYDGMERLRVRTLSNQTPASNNGTTHYVWDVFGHIIAETNGSTGASQRETIWLQDLPLAAVNAAAASPRPVFSIHVDHLNRPVLMTNAARAARAAMWEARYDPFGVVRSVTGTAVQNLGLPGQWFQPEAGLWYNWHRHYDPTTGRYTTPDPLGFVDGPGV
jgi:RHS repeat-associated protein